MFTIGGSKRECGSWEWMLYSVLKHEVLVAIHRMISGHMLIQIFFCQNDSNSNTLKFGIPYAEYSMHIIAYLCHCCVGGGDGGGEMFYSSSYKCETLVIMR